MMKSPPVADEAASQARTVLEWDQEGTSLVTSSHINTDVCKTLMMLLGYTLPARAHCVCVCVCTLQCIFYYANE